MHHDNDNALRFLSVCSGIEAASVAWPHWQALGFAEIDKAASAVLAHHYPDVPNHGDFTKIDTTKLGRVDILCGGTPCQAFSVAGARGGLNDARGNLSLEYVRLAHELADGNGLRNAVWENVPGVLSTKDNAFGCFLAGLVGADAAVIPSAKPADGKSSRHWKWRKGGRYPVLDDEGEPTGEYVTVEPWHALTWPSHGMVAGPKGRAAWAVKDAQYFGVAQRRRRVLVIADFGNGADPAAVLFEPDSVCRDSPPSRETGEGVAGRTSYGISPDCLDRDGEGAGGTAGERSGLGLDKEIAYALRAKRAGGVAYTPEIARCVATREGSSQDFESTTMVVSVTGQITHSLTAEGHDASEDGSGRGTPIIAFNAEAQADQLPGVGRDTSLNDGLTVSQRAAIASKSAARRLTPKECERLQGFPDNYSRIPVRWYPKKKVTRTRPDDMWEADPAGGFWLMAADGPRYKQLGNSWAVPKFRWLGERIERLMPPVAAQQEAANGNQELRCVA